MTDEQAKVPVWTLPEALDLIKELQPLVRTFDYHIALGGGVLNEMESYNDLDLYLLPVFRDRPYIFAALEQILYEKFGGHSDLCQTSQGPTGREGATYKHQWRYQNGGKVVDVFIADPTPTVKE